MKEHILIRYGQAVRKVRLEQKVSRRKNLLTVVACTEPISAMLNLESETFP